LRHHGSWQCEEESHLLANLQLVSLLPVGLSDCAILSKTSLEIGEGTKEVKH